MKFSPRNSQEEPAAGFTLAELLATIAIAAFLSFLIASNLGHRLDCGNRINCVNNLKNIGLGFETYAADFQGCYPWRVPKNDGGFVLPRNGGPTCATNNLFTLFACISNELSTPKIIRCRSDMRPAVAANSWSYGLSLGTESARIPSYFLGLDVSESNPKSILSGDRNLLIRLVGLDFQTKNNYNKITLIEPADVLSEKQGTVGWSTNIHEQAGNLLLRDGSVLQCSSRRAKRAFKDACLNQSANFRLFSPALEE